MLEIQNRITGCGVLIIIWWCINEAPAPCFSYPGEIEILTDLPVWNLLQSKEILIFCRNFNSTAPPAGAIKGDSSRIGNLSPVNIQLVLVKAFIERI